MPSEHYWPVDQLPCVGVGETLWYIVRKTGYQVQCLAGMWKCVGLQCGIKGAIHNMAEVHQSLSSCSSLTCDIHLKWNSV